MTYSAASVQKLADYLSAGYWWDVGYIPNSFAMSQSNVITVNLTGLTSAGRELAIAALKSWEAVADISFKAVTGAANITFDDNQAGAYCDAKCDAAGNITSAHVNVSTAWLSNYGTAVGSYSFQTYIHEIGHALGLGHSGDYNGTAAFQRDARFSHDSWQTTVMSYFDQSENLAIDASYAQVVSPMMADILAIQQLYGSPQNGPTSGNTVYGVNSNLGTYMDGVFGAGAGHLTRNALTIYDRGGYDRINFSDDTQAQRVDLRGGTFSDVYGLAGNLGIAFGTVIEAYVAGSDGDYVTGNAAANRIWLRAGDDVSYGKGGKDDIRGGSGADRMYGGGGDDKLCGGHGNDYLAGSKGNDWLSGGAGNDRLNGGPGADSFVFRSGHDVVTKFLNDIDTLVLDDTLWAGRSLSVSQVLNFARVDDGDILFDFVGDHSLRIKDMTSIRALADDLTIV